MAKFGAAKFGEVNFGEPAGEEVGDEGMAMGDMSGVSTSELATPEALPVADLTPMSSTQVADPEGMGMTEILPAGPDTIAYEHGISLNDASPLPSSVMCEFEAIAHGDDAAAISPSFVGPPPSPEQHQREEDEAAGAPPTPVPPEQAAQDPSGGGRYGVTQMVMFDTMPFTPKPMAEPLASDEGATLGEVRPEPAPETPAPATASFAFGDIAPEADDVLVTAHGRAGEAAVLRDIAPESNDEDVPAESVAFGDVPAKLSDVQAREESVSVGDVRPETPDSIGAFEPLPFHDLPALATVSVGQEAMALTPTTAERVIPSEGVVLASGMGNVSYADIPYWKLPRSLLSAFPGVHRTTKGLTRSADVRKRREEQR